MGQRVGQEAKMKLLIYRDNVEMPVVVDTEELPTADEPIQSYINRCMADNVTAGRGDRLLWCQNPEHQESTITAVVLSGDQPREMMAE